MYYFFLIFTCAVVTLTYVNSNQRPIEVGTEYIGDKPGTPNHKRVYDLKRLKNKLRMTPILQMGN